MHIEKIFQSGRSPAAPVGIKYTSDVVGRKHVDDQMYNQESGPALLGHIDSCWTVPKLYEDSQG